MLGREGRVLETYVKQFGCGGGAAGGWEVFWYILRHFGTLEKIFSHLTVKFNILIKFIFLVLNINIDMKNINRLLVMVSYNIFNHVKVNIK